MKNQEDLNNSNDKEIFRKRKNSNNNGSQDFEDLQAARKRHNDIDQEDENGFNLTLSLSFGCSSKSKKPSLKSQLSLSLPPSPQPLPPPQEIPLSLQLESQETQITTPTPLQLSASHSLFKDINMPLPEPSFYTAPPTPTPPVLHRQEPSIACPSRAPRARRNPTQVPREGKSQNVPVLFPWATNQRATVHSLDYLLSKQIETITGAVQCKRCEKQYEIGFDLREKFLEVGTYIAENKDSMRDRAPSSWMNPILPSCQHCQQENSVKPVISEKKKAINWLFLLLGQMLGCCTLEQLKYFCKHTKNHRTGAKDRVLYLTYLGLCKQLDPNGPFDR